NQLIKSDLNGYYLYNNHGDVIQLTDKQGTVTTSYLYDAFGIEQEPQPNDPNPFRYCGEYLDKESGNVYLRARYYDPETGRFISEDPIRDGLNWYVYCNNDPVNYFDPRGLAIGDVTMPNGDVIHGTITDGITHLPDGSRPPEGAVVETAAGFYMMLNGSGVEVTPTSVTTSSGSNVTGYNAGGTTYMLGGSRPTVGSTVHTSGGDYIMTASGIGNKVYSGSSSSSSSSSKYNPYDIMSVSKSCGGALVDTCNEPNTKQAIINTGLLAYDQIRRITQVPIVGTKLKLKLPYINSGDPEFEEARKQADKWTAFSPSSWFRP
ncbi:MAG TPA: RHS repeat-associated core domain-containing protein, partial [Syntrophomonadaceae bacterium]|nr:RHS repeat-associated core domain-containing protein [Syntrophomonadaceae bacterium]